MRTWIVCFDRWNATTGKGENTEVAHVTASDAIDAACIVAAQEANIRIRWVHPA